METNCKNCGGLVILSSAEIGICDYCGTNYAPLPVLKVPEIPKPKIPKSASPIVIGGLAVLGGAILPLLLMKRFK